MALSYDKFGFSEKVSLDISIFFRGGGGGKEKQTTSKRLNIPSDINVWDRRKCNIFTMIHRGLHSNSFLKSPLVSLKCFFLSDLKCFLAKNTFTRVP